MSGTLAIDVPVRIPPGSIVKDKAIDSFAETSVVPVIVLNPKYQPRFVLTLVPVGIKFKEHESALLFVIVIFPVDALAVPNEISSDVN